MATQEDVIAQVIHDVQEGLRALHDLAEQEIGSAGVNENDHHRFHILTKVVTRDSHRMLDECVKSMGEMPAGNYMDPIGDLAKRKGVEVKPRKALRAA